jgi:hypothetical protein
MYGIGPSDTIRSYWHVVNAKILIQTARLNTQKTMRINSKLRLAFRTYQVQALSVVLE